MGIRRVLQYVVQLLSSYVICAGLHHNTSKKIFAVDCGCYYSPLIALESTVYFSRAWPYCVLNVAAHGRNHEQHVLENQPAVVFLARVAT